SSFAYKGKIIDVRVIARDLGVRYVLEGSVRKGVGQLRVTTQLIDAMSGNQIWAQRYDRALADIFALQDRSRQMLSQRSSRSFMRPKIIGPSKNLQRASMLGIASHVDFPSS